MNNIRIYRSASQTIKNYIIRWNFRELVRTERSRRQCGRWCPPWRPWCSSSCGCWPRLTTFWAWTRGACSTWRARCSPTSAAGWSSPRCRARAWSCSPPSSRPPWPPCCWCCWCPASQPPPSSTSCTHSQVRLVFNKQSVTNSHLTFIRSNKHGLWFTLQWM